MNITSRLVSILCLTSFLISFGEGVKWKIRPNERVIVSEGESITLKCEFDELNASKEFVMWLKNGVTLSLNEKLADLKSTHLYEIKNEYNLYIRNVTSQESGQYTCQIFQSDEFKSHVNVSVLVAPKEALIVTHTTKKNIVEGDQVSFECLTNKDVYPAPIYKWYAQNNDLIHESFDNRLHINNISRHQNAFKCEILNDQMNRSFQTTIKLSVEYKPSTFIQLNSNLSLATNEFTLFENETELQLNCISNALPASYSYEWYLNNDKQLLLPGYNNSKLILNNLNYKQHNGIYSCKSSNKHGSHTSSIKLNIIYANLLDNQQGNVIQSHEHQNITLECLIRTNMMIVDVTQSIKWFFQEKLSSNLSRQLNSPAYINHRNGNQIKSILKLNSIDHETHQGFYKCVFEQNQQQDSLGKSRNFQLKSLSYVNIQYRPKISIETNEVFAQNNDRIELTCVIRASPALTQLSWHFNAQPLVSSYKYNMTTKWLKSNDLFENNSEEQIEMRLSINSLSEHEFGTYECKALNILGESIQSIHINKLTQPRAPFDLHVSNITSTSIRLNWKMRANYNESYLLNINQRELVVNGHRNSVLVQNLDENKMFLLRLKAFNQLGSSDFTDEVRVALEKETISNDLFIKRLYLNDKTEEICYELSDTYDYDRMRLKIREKTRDGSESSTLFTFVYPKNDQNCIAFKNLTNTNESVYYETPIEHIKSLNYFEFKNEYALAGIYLCSKNECITSESSHAAASSSTYDYYMNYYYYLILIIVCSSILFIFLLFSLLCCLLTRPRLASTAGNDKCDYQKGSSSTTKSNTLSIETIESDLQSSSSSTTSASSSLSSQKFYQLYSATLIPAYGQESLYSTPKTKKLFYEVIV